MNLTTPCSTSKNCHSKGPFRKQEEVVNILGKHLATMLFAAYPGNSRTEYVSKFVYAIRLHTVEFGNNQLDASDYCQKLWPRPSLAYRVIFESNSFQIASM